MRLLALDTATEWCSVALWDAGQVRWRAARSERGHGGQVLRLLDELLAESGLALGQFDAIAFGRGPGAFTGVRLAASLTQGLAYSVDRPVIPISDLLASAQQALWPPEHTALSPSRVLVCQDARMGEVYWGAFERDGQVAVEALPEAVATPERVVAGALAWLAVGPAMGAGSGFAAYPVLHEAYADRLHPLMTALAPHAREIVQLAAHAGLGAARPPAEAQPVYLRNNVAIAAPDWSV